MIVYVNISGAYNGSYVIGSWASNGSQLDWLVVLWSPKRNVWKMEIIKTGSLVLLFASLLHYLCICWEKMLHCVYRTRNKALNG